MASSVPTFAMIHDPIQPSCDTLTSAFDSGTIIETVLAESPAMETPVNSVKPKNKTKRYGSADKNLYLFHNDFLSCT